MLTRSTSPLLNLAAQSKTIPIIENRAQLERVFHAPQVKAILLRHCNLFELLPLLQLAYQRQLAIYVNVDHINGISPDAAGLRFIALQCHTTGIISNNPRILTLGKGAGLETIQRVFAIDSTGLETALETVDPHAVDLLDISPALVIPYIVPHLTPSLPLPFIGSGLVYTSQQVQAVLRTGALGIAVARTELWR